MERDSRRDRGQWRGCYTFKDIVCDGDAGSIPKRNGALKMGQTYYYYYELDASSETHDPSQPSTTTCPYLPGQTVNTLWVPVEQSRRKRSASLTSLREEDFKTMNPASKFVSPRPAPSPPTEPARRVGTAPLRMQPQKRPARSPSPSSRWLFSPRKLFSRKSSSSSLRDVQTPQPEDDRSLRSEGSRSRDISPESLRRFLVDDAPLDLEHEDNTNRPAIDIPEDIVEENEDDDNFATSAVSESMQFTGLSPPPQRAPSPAMTIIPQAYLTPPAAPTRPPPRLPSLNTTTKGFQHSHPLSAIPARIGQQQLAPRSPDDVAALPAFYLSDSEDDEDDEDDSEESLSLPGVDMDVDVDDNVITTPTATFAHGANPFARNLDATLSTYSLPRTAVVGAGACEAPVLSSPIPDAGLGELVSELGWMAEYV